jgi:HK97 family phage prohead protease
MRYTSGLITKSVQSKDFDGTAVLSDVGTPDRVGDIFEDKDSVYVLDEFKKNAPVLYAHDHEKIIGQWKNVRRVGKQLVADFKLASTPLAQMAKTLVDEGILRAVSIGFNPLDYEPLDEKDPWGAWLIKSAEIMEASFVSVPANPRALIAAKSFGLDKSERELVFGASSVAMQIDPEIREKATNPAVLKAANVLEKARKTLDR